MHITSKVETCREDEALWVLCKFGSEDGLIQALGEALGGSTKLFELLLRDLTCIM